MLSKSRWDVVSLLGSMSSQLSDIFSIKIFSERSSSPVYRPVFKTLATSILRKFEVF
jgi:hypothetical protein